MRPARAFVLLSSFVAIAATGACKSPPCKEGKLDAAWQSAPLSVLVPKEATACEGSSSTTATFWKPVRVHDANMAAVDAAQDNGWTRTSDNWYSTKGDFDTPKWSEFKGAAGALRVDVHEANGGSTIVVKLTPKP